MPRFVTPEALAGAVRARSPVTGSGTASGFAVGDGWATVAAVDLAGPVSAVQASFSATCPEPFAARLLVSGSPAGESASTALAPLSLWPSDLLFPSEGAWPGEGAAAYRSQGSAMSAGTGRAVRVELQVMAPTPFAASASSEARLFARADRGPL